MDATTLQIDKTTAVVNVLRLISNYRHFEKMPFTKGYTLIHKFAPVHLKGHLCNAWKRNERDFAGFYLNLDYKIQNSLLKLWGLSTEVDDTYVQKSEDDPRAMIFEIPTGFLSVARTVLLYFNNTGIGDSNDRVNHHHLPTERYGNSSNWADYLIGESFEEQARIIMQIIN